MAKYMRQVHSQNKRYNQCSWGSQGQFQYTNDHVIQTYHFV